MRRVTWIVAFVAVLASPVLGQAERANALITRVYDIRDLIMDIRDFPFTGAIGMPVEEGAMGGGGGGQSLFGGGQGAEEHKERKEQTRAERAEQLTKLIMETVEPGSWREAGGAIGSIREVSGMLIVTQTKDAHALIADVFRQLRETNGAVRIRADWVLLEPDDVATMLADAADAPAAAPKPIDPKALASLPQEAVHYRAELSCFSGQTVSMSSGRGRTVVYDQEPVVAQGAVAAGPTIRQVQAGVALEVSPLVIADAGSAVVEVAAKVVQWDDSVPATQPVVMTVKSDETATIKGGSVDRLNLVSQSLRTTVRVPLDKPVLVGGMTLEPTTAAARGPQLYLILRVTGGQQPDEK
jgi:hypothetical protein